MAESKRSNVLFIVLGVVLFTVVFIGVFVLQAQYSSSNPISPSVKIISTPVVDDANIQDKDIVGCWMDDDVVGSGYGERYCFGESKIFFHIKSQYEDSSDEDYVSIGMWDIVNNELILSFMEREYSSGVVDVSDSLKYIVQLPLGKLEKTDTSSTKEYRIKIDEIYFWKFSDDNFFWQDTY